MSRRLPKKPDKAGRPRPSVELRRLVVFTEGSKTEVGYINHWASLNRDRVTVAIDRFHGPPRKLVERAARTRRANVHERRRRGGDPNEYWCICDRDQHAKVDEALKMAGDNEIEVVLSTPCIELWFVFTSGIREPIWRPSRPRAHREISFGAGRHCPAKLCTSCRTDSVRQEAAPVSSTAGTKRTDRHRDPTRAAISGDSSTGSTSSRAIRPRSANRSHEVPSMPPTATVPFSLGNSGPLPPGTASRSCPAVRSRNRRVRILVGSASAILTIGAENECPARVVGAGPRGDVLPLRRCAWGESRSGLRVLVA